MVSLLQKSATVIVQGLLSLCALLFIGLIVIQLTLVIGINAISAGAGTDFIAGKINQALAPSGYDVAFDGLYYDPVRGISIHNLSISDNRGQFLTMDRFSLAASFLLSPLQTVELSARGGTLTLERIPVTQNTEESEISEPITPFAAPDIFFRKIILTDLSFDRVVLGKDVAGSVYELSPSLYASITLQDDMTLSATLRPGLPQLAQNLDSPQAIVMDAVFTPATLAFSLNEFSILAKNYSLTARGDGALGENGVVSLATQVRHNDLSILSADAIRSASADVRIKGPLSGPALNIAADIVTGSLKERGLSDIKVSLATENINQGIAGAARIETTYKDDPITVDAFLSYDAPALRITDLEGSAPDIILNGDGIFSTDTALFDGSLTIDAKNLARYSELAGVTLGGSLTAEASFKPSNASAQSADIKATIAKGVAGMISVRDLSAQAFIAALSNPWPQSAKIDASAIEISDKITLRKLSATITEGESENYRLALKGDGAVPIPVSFDGSADFSDLTKPVPDIMDIAFNIKQGASTIRLGGDFTTEAVNLTFSTKNFRGQDIPAQLPSQLSDLRIDLDAAMTGTPAQPRTELNAKLRGLGQGTYQSASIDIKAYHDGQALTANITGQGTGIRKLAADVSTPMELSLLPFVFALDQSSPVNGTMTADIDLSAFAPLLLPPTQDLSGTLTANGTIEGAIGSPAPVADIRLTDASFEDVENGILIANLSAGASVNRDTLTLSSLSGTDGESGVISGGGTMSFNQGTTDLNVRLKNFHVPRTTIADGRIDANIELAGMADGLMLSGSADILQMDITIPETFSSNIPQLNIVEDKEDGGTGLLDELTLDIDINANNQVFVRGWGLDAEFEGNIAVTGTASVPQLNGTLSSRRGRYEEFGKRFTLTRGNLRFQGDVPPSPYLDIEATTPAGDVTGSIILAGPVMDPSITFSSTPSLPEDEVLSRILFGKDSARISAFQAVQLTQTIRRFSGEGGGGFDPLGVLRDATGFDDISVDMDESGGANVNVGKYLTDNVYLELGRGKAENSGEATIQIEVTPSINIESEIGQDAQGGGGIFWKRDY